MEKKTIRLLRFSLVYFVLLFLFMLPIGKMFRIQLIEREHWMELAKSQVRTDIEVKPNRGNIYSSDGRLMASSIPSYVLYMDPCTDALREDGSKLFYEYVDSVSVALSGYFGDKSASEYRRMLVNAHNSGKRYLRLYPHRISYFQLKDVLRFPLFNKGRMKSGLIPQLRTDRVKPFGSLASRTIGNIYGDATKGGSSGLEMYFDDVLRGEPGKATRQMIANKRIEYVEKEPRDGSDLITTIDVDIQDVAEEALLNELNRIGAHSGYVVMMEVHSGEVKAIVNMERSAVSGAYVEMRNGVVSDMAEPGSTFKTASLMAAIDDGYVSIYDSVDVGTGIEYFYNVAMRDHNYKGGKPGTGYGKITVENALEASSNVGISHVIVEHYGKHPEKFVEKLYEMGLTEPLNLEIPGTASPNIRSPKDENVDWSGTTLPWMSIGYEVQIPPIYTLTFYNAIANGGKMIKPFFVKEIRHDGELVESFETEVIRSKICSQNTLDQIKIALEGVVWHQRYATAKAVRSSKVKIAGKTGTAQISNGLLGYKYGGKSHQVSFCGYFPADDPMYTCLCVIRRPAPGYAPSGGTMAGSVVRNIAERTMAMKVWKNVEDLVSDSTFVYEMPTIKRGRYESVWSACHSVGLDLDNARRYRDMNCEWARISLSNDTLSVVGMSVNSHTVPNVIGMGLRDAVFAIEQTGMSVRVSGVGKVIRQSVAPGAAPTKGATVYLELKP